MASFYEENRIKAALKCAICEDQLCDPITLPCNRNVCKECVFGKAASDSNNNLPKTIKCRLCAKIHRVPTGGFAANPTLVDLLHEQPIKVERSEEYEALCNNITEIKSKLSALDFSINRGIGRIRDHCSLLSSEI